MTNVNRWQISISKRGRFQFRTEMFTDIRDVVKIYDELVRIMPDAKIVVTGWSDRQQDVTADFQ